MADSGASQHFKQLIDTGHPVGEVISVDRFVVKVKGMQPCNIHSLVMFEDGSKGFVHKIFEDHVVVLHMGSRLLTSGVLVAVQHDQLVSRVGEDFIGRIISPNGTPIDGKGAIAADAVWPIFKEAPPFIERAMLDMQLETGVTVIDTLVPLVRGQRIAVLGDSKVGKATLANQIIINQKNSGIITIIALIAKRRSDVDALVSLLEKNDALKNTIVIVSTTFDPLVSNFLTPYVATALGEYLWQEKNKDVLIVYNDLTNHAQIYREISLISGTSPGRDSYPGDIFYIHSSLLERAGKLSKNGKTLTSLPLVLVPGGDITAYLPTNVMSMTDGQWILDMDVYREGLKPALNIGLSVSRVGGRGQTPQQHQFATKISKAIAAYNQAKEFSHFGSELALNAKKDMALGQQLFKLFDQRPGESYSTNAQKLMLEILLESEDNQLIDVNALKGNAEKLAAEIKSDSDFDMIRQELKELATLELKK